MTKTYIAVVRDHSGSMRSLATGALNDYNLLIDGIKQSVAEENQIAYLTVVECGVGHSGIVRVVETNTPLGNIRNITSYQTTGSATPLFDSVGEAIYALENIAESDKYDPTVAFLVMVITDGQENSSRRWNANNLKAKIMELQATDRWSFVFRVPRGYGSQLTKFGVPAGNIMEWEQTERSLAESTVATVGATTSYFKSRSAGQTKVTSFYSDLSNVSREEIVAKLEDISAKVRVAWVSDHDAGRQIRDFCNEKFGVFAPGKACYQLTKSELVQDYKEICIKDKTSGQIYKGPAARQMLGLPRYGNIRLIPGKHGSYDIFVQSNSVNRKLVNGTSVLYLP